MNAARISILVGAVALLLLLGALGFQYLGGLAPCEMCHWQRWPLIAAAAIGIGGGSLMAVGTHSSSFARLAAIAAILLVAISGAIGLYQAGVEFHWWAGPSACTGARVIITGALNLNTGPVVRCDVPAFRLFGISLAGYNAIISLTAACIGAVLLAGKRQ